MLTVISQEKIFCDEVEIEQVLLNLLNNSVYAVKDLEQRWIQIDISEGQATVVIRVRDSGTGISATTREKLFEPFYTTKPVGEGTGLGLSVTKGILDEHGATIELLADDPHTCFELIFPVRLAKNATS